MRHGVIDKSRKGEPADLKRSGGRITLAAIIMGMNFDRGWFPRRRIGLGWALHRSWQGWVLMVVVLGLVTGGMSWFENTEAYSAFVTVVLLAAVGLCWWKGERSIARGDRV